MRRKAASYFTAALAALLLALSAVPAGAEVVTQYLYNLSDFNGPMPYYWGRVTPDDEQSETYVVSGNTVDIFDRNAMKIYDFMYDEGNVYDAAVLPGGDILLLAMTTSGMRIVRCNYRGEPQSTIGISGVPEELAKDVRYNRMSYRDGELYLVDQGEMRVVVVDMHGEFRQGFDIAALLQLGEEDKNDTGMSGFNVDAEGDILFTISATAKAAKVTPDGKLYMFGKRGSGSGKLGVPSGIAADAKGNLFVADKLRCVVLIFNKDGQFLKEFGFRGFGPGNLIVPSDVVIDGRQRVYVSQLRARGVSVFRIEYR